MKKKFYQNIFLLISYLQNKNYLQTVFLAYHSINLQNQHNHLVISSQFPLHHYKQFV